MIEFNYTSFLMNTISINIKTESKKKESIKIQKEKLIYF